MTPKREVACAVSPTSPWPAYGARCAPIFLDSRAKHAGPATQRASVCEPDDSFALADASALDGLVKPGHGEMS
jgi:hypothetical protein